MPTETIRSGTVKFFNRARGFGVLTADDGEEVLAHSSGLSTAQQEISPGVAVTFETAPHAKDPDKKQAMNVTVVKSAAEVTKGVAKLSVEDAAPAKSKRQAKKERTEAAATTAAAAPATAEVPVSTTPATDASPSKPPRNKSNKSPRNAAGAETTTDAAAPAASQPPTEAKPQRPNGKSPRAKVQPEVATEKGPADPLPVVLAGSAAEGGLPKKEAAREKMKKAKPTPPTAAPQSEESTASTVLKTPPTPEKAEKSAKGEKGEPRQTKAQREAAQEAERDMAALMPGAKSVTVVDIEDEARTKTFIYGNKLYVVQF